MSFWTAIVAIVAIATIAAIMRERYRAMGRIERGRQQESEWIDLCRRETRVEELRERIKVLERIATDNNSLDARQTKQIAAK